MLLLTQSLKTASSSQLDSPHLLINLLNLGKGVGEAADEDDAKHLHHDAENHEDDDDLVIDSSL